MKKMIFTALPLTVLLSSCATIFAGGTGCDKKPATGEPRREIRAVPFIFDIFYGFGVGLAIDFATGDIYKPCSEMRPSVDKSFEWSETIEVPGASKSVLYQRGIEWFNATFNDMRAVIQDKDKDAGSFYGKGVILSRDLNYNINNSYFGSSDVVTFSINIAIKEGKYKYTMSGFSHAGTRTQYSRTYPKNGGLLNQKSPEMRIGKRQWAYIRDVVHDKVSMSLIPSLKSKMSTQSLPESF